VRSENDQEIRGGILNNIVEKTRHSVHTPMGLPFHRTPHDNEESQHIFNGEVINHRDADAKR
jgi:hypothetical protein